MRITEAARRLGTSPRTLRYRDSLGLLPAVRGGRAGSPSRAGHRQFSGADLAAVSLALDIERRYDVTPAALAFALRVLTEPGVRADVAELGRRTGRIPSPPARALEFEKERALRLLGLPAQPAVAGGHRTGRRQGSVSIRGDAGPPPGQASRASGVHRNAGPPRGAPGISPPPGISPAPGHHPSAGAAALPGQRGQ
jgi:MerR family copper efflux transcriptional regulator